MFEKRHSTSAPMLYICHAVTELIAAALFGSLCKSESSTCFTPYLLNADGKSKLLDLETGLHDQLLDLNPNG